VLLQSEPFYLCSAFPAFNRGQLLTPSLHLSGDVQTNLPALREVARRLGVSPARIRPALQAAEAAQRDFFSEIRQMGREMLAQLAARKEGIGVVLFGRPYNAFTAVANKGIPPKFASRGFAVIPCDMLPYERSNSMRISTCTGPWAE